MERWMDVWMDGQVDRKTNKYVSVEYHTAKV